LNETPPFSDPFRYIFLFIHPKFRTFHSPSKHAVEDKKFKGFATEINNPKHNALDNN